MITSMREAELAELSRMFSKARAENAPIVSVEERFAPRDQAEAYFVQDRLAAQFGEIGGWKIGASTPSATPSFAPMPRRWMIAPGDSVPASHSRLRGVEVEVAFLLAHDMPPRSTIYTREEISAAIASAHSAIEIIESALSDPTAVLPLVKSADLQINGGFIYGPAFENWQSIDWATQTASLIVNGSVRLERTASNSAGMDLLRLLLYIANEGSTRTGGLRKGQWVTTGSWTALAFCHPGDHVKGRFTNSGAVTLKFE